MKKTIKRIITIILTCAIVLLMVPADKSRAAEVKLNKTKLTIYEDETATLKLKGAKSVTFTSGDKKIATVSKKGVVTGVKKGSCDVTAKDEKTGKKYVCKVTVKAAKSLKIKEGYISEGGNAFWYKGKKIDGAGYYMDGNELDVEIWDGGDGGYVSVSFEPVEDGKHVFEVKKKGYKTYTIEFNYTAPTGLIIKTPWVGDMEGAKTLILFLNPDVKEDDETKVIKIDGKKATITWDMGVNGDGLYIIWIDASKLKKGKHTITVKVDGFDKESAKFTVE